jgi:hypothetical protein
MIAGRITALRHCDDAAVTLLVVSENMTSDPAPTPMVKHPCQDTNEAILIAPLASFFFLFELPRDPSPILRQATVIFKRDSQFKLWPLPPR